MTKGKTKINTQTPYIFTFINKYITGLQWKLMSYSLIIFLHRLRMYMDLVYCFINVCHSSLSMGLLTFASHYLFYVVLQGFNTKMSFILVFKSASLKTKQHTQPFSNVSSPLPNSFFFFVFLKFKWLKRLLISKCVFLTKLKPQ